jgi:hypothetical protein
MFANNSFDSHVTSARQSAGKRSRSHDLLAHAVAAVRAALEQLEAVAHAVERPAVVALLAASTASLEKIRIF